MITKEIEIPENVKIEISGNSLKVNGPKGEVDKQLPIPPGFKIEVKENKVVVSSESDKKKDKAIVGTLIAHVRNAIKGVIDGWTYKLRIVYSHFPINVRIDGDNFIIENFLGERKPRIAKILDGVKVEIKKKDIIVTGLDIDKVSQTAANIEQATRIVGKDRRVFQDGIYIIEKKGKPLV